VGILRLQLLYPHLLPLLLSRDDSSLQVSPLWLRWMERLSLEQIRWLWVRLPKTEQYSWFQQIDRQLQGEDQLTALFRLFIAAEQLGKQDEDDPQPLDQLLEDEPLILQRIARFRDWEVEDLQFLNDDGLEYLLATMENPIPESTFAGCSQLLIERVVKYVPDQELLEQFCSGTVTASYEGEQALQQLLIRAVVAVESGQIEPPQIPLYNQFELLPAQVHKPSKEQLLRCDWSHSSCNEQDCPLYLQGERCQLREEAKQLFAAGFLSRWYQRSLDWKGLGTYLDTLSREGARQLFAQLPSESVYKLKSYTLRNFYSLDQILSVSNENIQSLLRDTPTDELVIALKESKEVVCNKILGEMSGRAKAMVEEDMTQASLYRWSTVEQMRERLLNRLEKICGPEWKAKQKGLSVGVVDYLHTQKEALEITAIVSKQFGPKPTKIETLLSAISMIIIYGVGLGFAVYIFWNL
jgi:hypothetical protein